MEEIGRQFGIADRATLCRATDLALLITRCCGRLPPSEEPARPVIALELACQERGMLGKFDRHLAAKLTNRPLPMYIKICDKIVNALLSNSSSSSDGIQLVVTIEGITGHFNCTMLVPGIHAIISKLPAMPFPWRCLIGAALIVLSGHLKISLIPMRVAEYVHLAWKDVQMCVKQIKTILSADDLESISSAVTIAAQADHDDDQSNRKDTVMRTLKPRDIPYLFSVEEPKYGRYAHIGLNRIQLVGS